MANGAVERSLNKRMFESYESQIFNANRFYRQCEHNKIDGLCCLGRSLMIACSKRHRQPVNQPGSALRSAQATKQALAFSRRNACTINPQKGHRPYLQERLAIQSPIRPNRVVQADSGFAHLFRPSWDLFASSLPTLAAVTHTP